MMMIMHMITILTNLFLRFGHSMVSGLFEPIGHKKWPLKFHFHDFQEFVLGDDGRAYQNELRVCFSSKKTIAKKQKRINIQDLVFGYDRRAYLIELAQGKNVCSS